MEAAKFKKIESLSLKASAEFSEAWVQQVLFDNPELLGLGGDLEAIAKEKVQASGGKLDLLFRDPEANTRYEVEVQLGATDESHIIRTIEYWDLERRHYPAYDHVAVIVAEEITSRFFNVISLFNSALPIIAIKMTAIRYPDGEVGLLFTKVLDLQRPADEEAPAVVTDKPYWENKSSPKMMKLAESILGLIREFEPLASYSYTKFYLGIWVAQKAMNFVVVRPKKQHVLIDIKLDRTDETDAVLDAAGIEFSYIAEGRYRVKVEQEPKEKIREQLFSLMKKAWAVMR